MHPAKLLDLAVSDGARPKLYFAWGCFRNFWSRLGFERTGSRLFRAAYESRALALPSLPGTGQQADQELSLRRMRSLRGDTCGVHGREFAARWQRTGQLDAAGADDLGRLRATDRPRRIRRCQFAHRGCAVREDPEPGGDVVADAE